MDSVAFVFADAVCQRLSGPMFCKFKQFPGLWSEVGAIHKDNRREYRLALQFWESHYIDGDPWACRQWLGKEFNPKYDRITYIAFCNGVSPQYDTSSKFVRECVLPRLLPFTADCLLDVSYDVGSHPILKEFYRIFKHCSGFTSIRISNQMEESSEFVERQLEYGNLESLTFIDYSEQEPWPESLAPLLRRFVLSPNFRILKLNGIVRLVFELASLFMERWQLKTLKKGSQLSGDVSFPERDLHLFFAKHKPFPMDGGYAYQVNFGDGRISVYEKLSVHMQYGSV